MNEFNYNSFFEKLDQFIRQKNLIQFLENSIKSVLFFIGWFFLISLIELVFNFASSGRLILFISLMVGLASFLLSFIFLPFVKFIKTNKFSLYLQVSKFIGEKFDDIKDKLVNTLQLIFNLDKENFYSRELLLAAIESNLKKFSNYDFNKILSFDKVKYLTKVFLIIIISFIGLGFSFPDLPFASYRILNFNRDFERPPEFYIVIEPGNAKITRGDNYVCRIKTIGKSLDKINLFYRFDGMEVYEKQELKADSTGDFSYTFLAPNRSFSFYAQSKNVKSKNYTVEVINFPVIKELSVKILPPSYTRLPIQTFEDDGNINTVKGSLAEISLTSSKNLSSAKIVFDDSSQLKLNVNQTKASIRFPLKKSGIYKIIIFDEFNYSNQNPVEYQINLTEDAFPSITLIQPTDAVSLTDNMRVPLIFRIKDDFGFSKLILNYRLSFSRYEEPRPNYTKVEIPFNSTLDTVLTYIWNLTNLNLVTDDVVSYYLEVFDNDYISGPKSAQTAVMTVRLPSLEEILAESDEKFESSIEHARTIQKEIEELKQSLEELDKDLKTPKDLRQQDKLTWEEQKKAEELIKKHEEILQQVESLQEKLNELQNQLNDNRTLSKETLQKFMELQELLNSLDSEELKDAIKKLNEAIQSLSRQLTQEALKNFKFNEENFRASIERTIQLLKRIQIEQKMDQALKQLDQLTQRQNEISEQLNNTNPNNSRKLDELSKEQERVSKDIENLENTLEELSERMKEFPDEMPEKELDELRDEFESSEPQQCSMRSSQEMKKGNVKSARENQDKLKNSLGKLQKGLNQLKQEMMRNQMRSTIVQLQKITSDLLTLSKEQEHLKNRTLRIESSSQQVNEIARKQSELMDNLRKVIDRMIDLSNKSFAVTPEMGRAVGKAMINMNSSIENLLNRNMFGSQQNQTEAMGNLNEAADLIQNMMQNMMQGGAGGGMMSFMQRLQQMAQQQMNLNNLTQMLGQGQLTMEQLSQLQRLAAEQEMIRKSLEQLNKEMRESGQSSRLLGDLEDVARRMEEVVRELKQNNVSDELIQKQERILTRLLDAQRSMNERDYEKRRESRPGEQITGKPPAEIRFDENDLFSKIRQDLLKALEQGYSKDYETLIRKYFESLMKEKVVNR